MEQSHDLLSFLSRSRIRMFTPWAYGNQAYELRGEQRAMRLYPGSFFSYHLIIAHADRTFLMMRIQWSYGSTRGWFFAPSFWQAIENCAIWLFRPGVWYPYNAVDFCWIDEDDDAIRVFTPGNWYANEGSHCWVLIPGFLDPNNNDENYNLWFLETDSYNESSTSFWSPTNDDVESQGRSYFYY